MAVDADAEAAGLRAALAAAGDPAFAVGAKKYLKSDLAFLGARTPTVRRAALDWNRSHRDLTRTDLLAVAQALWVQPVFDLRLLAAVLLERRVDVLRAADLPRLRRWLREARTWALVDQLAPNVVGPLLARDPALRTRTLTAWAKDGDFWVRRAALLAQLRDLRRGGGDWPLFCRLADAMLEEREFFLRKAIGWVLRERAKAAPADVVAFVAPRRARMSALTWREATRALPEKERRRLGGP